MGFSPTHISEASREHPRLVRALRFFGAVAMVFFGLYYMNCGLEHGLPNGLLDLVISNSVFFFGGIFFLILGVVTLAIIVSPYYKQVDS